MPARKPQPNYLPFFGPYSRDWSMEDQPQFLTWPPKQRKDPVSALEVFEKRGIEGARAEGGGIVFVGKKKEHGPIVRAAAKELGADIKQKSGRARLIEAKDYDSILKANEEQRALLTQTPSWKTVLLPAPLSAAATSYAANHRRKTQGTRRPPSRSAR